MKGDTTDAILKTLAGEKLSSITFVMDYLQMDFDGNGFNMYIWPEVIVDDEVYKFGENEYQNKLCSFITKQVKEIEYEDEVRLGIVFQDDNRIELSLDPNNVDIVAEIAEYRDTEGNWLVFQ
jgi:hypothetical protein